MVTDSGRVVGNRIAMPAHAVRATLDMANNHESLILTADDLSEKRVPYVHVAHLRAVIDVPVR